MNRSDLQATVKYLVKEIEKCQNILAIYIVPDSSIHCHKAMADVLGVLNNRNLVYFINSLKIKEQNDKSKDNPSGS